MRKLFFFMMGFLVVFLLSVACFAGGLYPRGDLIFDDDGGFTGNLTVEQKGIVGIPGSDVYGVLDIRAIMCDGGGDENPGVWDLVTEEREYSGDIIYCSDYYNNGRRKVILHLEGFPTKKMSGLTYTRMIGYVDDSGFFDGVLTGSSCGLVFRYTAAEVDPEVKCKKAIFSLVEGGITWKMIYHWMLLIYGPCDFQPNPIIIPNPIPLPPVGIKVDQVRPAPNYRNLVKKMMVCKEITYCDLYNMIHCSIGWLELVKQYNIQPCLLLKLTADQWGWCEKPPVPVSLTRINVSEENINNTRCQSALFSLIRCHQISMCDFFDMVRKYTSGIASTYNEVVD